MLKKATGDQREDAPGVRRVPGLSVEWAGMADWTEKTRLSLAAKCQLLFGAALALIIGAALVAPWQRMEQLRHRINERAASAVVRTAIAQHITDAQDGLAARKPTTLPVTLDGQTVTLPRLVGVPADLSTLESRFERAAIARFQRDPDLKFFARSFDASGSEGYRYAEPLYARKQCLPCHQDATRSTQPTTQTAQITTFAPLLGIAVVEIPAQVSQQEVVLNRTLLLIAVALAGTLAVLTFHLIFSRLILRPVRILQETAEKVSQGDLNIRSDISSRDEFQQLSETLNTMLANLKTSDEQLRAVNRSLDLRLGQLGESNVALYEANRLKSEFLANVSHELRTPLNSILGFADLLRESVGEEPRSSRYLRNILTSGKHLLELINDLLDLAKIEAGKIDVRSEPLALGDLFEALAGLLKPLLEEKELTIITRISSEIPILRTDASKLQQILYNLLSNAIKFSPVGQQIDLTCDLVEEGKIRIEVTDRGPGIAPDQQEAIFEKFRQLDGSHTRTHSGTGLGLAISRELATILQGEIGVESAPGRGSTFWLELPTSIEAGQRDVRERMLRP
jgi:signal transduction histidine kinase